MPMRLLPVSQPAKNQLRSAMERAASLLPHFKAERRVRLSRVRHLEGRLFLHGRWRQQARPPPLLIQAREAIRRTLLVVLERVDLDGWGMSSGFAAGRVGVFGCLGKGKTVIA